MAQTGRPATCDCDVCPKCKRRIYMRAWYQRKSPEERKLIVAARDPEKVRASDKARYYRDPQKRLRQNMEYARENPERVAEYRRRWLAKNPEKRKAQGKASYALRMGRITRGPCAREAEGTCEGRIEMHHENYAKPLEVTWLCHKHHAETWRVLS